MDRPYNLGQCIYEEDTYFDCQNCGLCCRTDWLIPVEKTKADRLVDFGPSLAVTQTKAGTFHLNKSQGACDFLTSDQRCLIHGELGANHKPLTCQAFPYTMTPTPDGVIVGLSHYCPSVRARIGTPLVEHKETIEPLLQQFDFPLETSGIITLIQDQVIGWTGYLEMEKEILRLLPSNSAAKVFWGAHSGISAHRSTWARTSLDELFSLPENLQELQAPAKKLADFLKLELHTEYLDDTNQRYFQSLVRRKILTRLSSVANCLAVLAVCALVLQMARDKDKCIEILELHLTHGKGFDTDLFER